MPLLLLRVAVVTMTETETVARAPNKRVLELEARYVLATRRYGRFLDYAPISLTTPPETWPAPEVVASLARAEDRCPYRSVPIVVEPDHPCEIDQTIEFRHYERKGANGAVLIDRRCVECARRRAAARRVGVPVVVDRDNRTATEPHRPCRRGHVTFRYYRKPGAKSGAWVTYRQCVECVRMTSKDWNERRKDR